MASAFDKLREENMKMNVYVDDLKNQLLQAKMQAKQWEQECESLRLANSMLGNQEEKSRAKLKINSLIRELDYCIDQLSN